MNKQELINELKRISLEKQHKALTHPESKNYYEGMVMAYSQVVHMVNTVLKLDEPQKPVVPKFVAEWFEDNKHALDLAIFTKIRELDGKRYPHETDFENWLDNAENNPIENLIRMIDGYEVEKEPLYTVTINLDRKYHLVVDEGDGNDEISTTLTTSHGVLGYRYFLTEKEIKSADENLWLFAVPVEEVAEG
ncbi:DUF1642 domain-containing protein [Enterococcus faecium]|nr:DUF1642 domain-containing protein [Enterococcus faecium]MCH3428738.1 DUF1642 domain-containing protein [Enterococcus faecium]MCH3594969.1 DUF1642 domain-containing protein [Enterococcus faecium]MCH3619978.1 DUF1642 domain-containing protein [Enterococcus faecium]MCH3685811.1 DUF1642 domain-containing protein [Enterococcus faecium]